MEFFIHSFFGDTEMFLLVLALPMLLSLVWFAYYGKQRNWCLVRTGAKFAVYWLVAVLLCVAFGAFLLITAMGTHGSRAWDAVAVIWAIVTTASYFSLLPWLLITSYKDYKLHTA